VVGGGIKQSEKTSAFFQFGHTPEAIRMDPRGERRRDWRVGGKRTIFTETFFQGDWLVLGPAGPGIEKGGRTARGGLGKRGAAFVEISSIERGSPTTTLWSSCSGRGTRKLIRRKKATVIFAAVKNH